MSKVKQIAQFGQELMALENIDNVLELISNEAKKLLNTERCSIFIVDKEDEILWTTLSDGVGRIVVSLNSGIVGDTYQKQEAQIVNLPYDDERFLSSIDKKSGYITKNIITVPIFDSQREVIGIIELLNKSRFSFDEKDLTTLTFFANYVSGSLELALMNRA
ncbi:MAG: GAF domain-containing protein [Sulfurimonas sp.]|jgi:GAF domain-containing protein|nr:GAF domain-containing protein [Sulfurimonas sp.]